MSRRIAKPDHTGRTLGDMTEGRSEAIQTMLAARAGEVIEGTPELDALPALNGPSPEAALEATLQPTKRKPNRLRWRLTTVQDKPRKRPPGPRSHDVPGISDDRD